MILEISNKGSGILTMLLCSRLTSCLVFSSICNRFRSDRDANHSHLSRHTSLSSLPCQGGNVLLPFTTHIRLLKHVESFAIIFLSMSTLARILPHTSSTRGFSECEALIILHLFVEQSRPLK